MSARRIRVLTIALIASIVAHFVLVIGGSGTGGRSEAPRLLDAPVITARVSPLPAPPEPIPVVQPVEQAPSPSADRPPPVPRAVVPLPPTLTLPPKPAQRTGTVDVVLAHDTEPAIEETFTAALARDYPGSRRIALEFEVAPVVTLAPEAMGEQPQRMLRALVIVKPLGDVELLTTHEYDVPYMDAIRDALRAAKAAPTPDGEIRWAIVVFWFQRTGQR